MRIEAVAFLGRKGQFHNGCVAFLYVNIRAAFLRKRSKLRLCFYHLIEAVKGFVRLIQLRCKAINFRAVFIIHIRHIGHDCGRKNGLSVFSAYDNENLPKHPQAVTIHDPKHT